MDEKEHSRAYISTRRELVRQEFARAARTRYAFCIPATHFPIYLEQANAALQRSHIRDRAQAEIVLRVSESLDRGAKQLGMSREAFEHGRTFFGRINVPTNVAVAFVYVAHVAVGARLLGGAGYYLGAELTTEFAALLADGFPNMAEQLVDSLRAEADVVIPEYLRKGPG